MYWLGWSEGLYQPHKAICAGSEGAGSTLVTFIIPSQLLKSMLNDEMIRLIRINLDVVYGKGLQTCAGITQGYCSRVR